MPNVCVRLPFSPKGSRLGLFELSAIFYSLYGVFSCGANVRGVRVERSSFGLRCNCMTMCSSLARESKSCDPQFLMSVCMMSVNAQTPGTPPMKINFIGGVPGVCIQRVEPCPRLRK